AAGADPRRLRPARQRRPRCRPGHQVKCRPSPHPGDRAGPCAGPGRDREGLRRRSQHRHPEARHLPRPREADEDVHRVLARGGRAAAGGRVTKLPDLVTVLVVQRDEQRHLPIQQALKAIERPLYTIHWVTSEDAARAALDEHPHDAFLVDADTGGLQLAKQILAHTPHAPVLLLDDAPDRDTDVAAAEAGVAECVTDPAALERALRYAITHQHALARLAESEQRHALAMQGANDGLWDWDVRRDRLYFSPRWKQMLGYSEPELGDARGEWLGRVHPDDRAALTQALEAHLSGASQHFEHEHRIQHRDGSYRWVLARGMAVRDVHGRATRVVGSQTDVTDRKQAEQRLQHDALHDALTGLPNRVLFLDRLDQAIRRAQRAHPTAAAAVLFLDLDRFKLVNDSLGHQVGDQLLIAVARRLESAVRPPDTVARLGGDEFTVLL